MGHDITMREVFVLVLSAAVSLMLGLQCASVEELGSELARRWLTEGLGIGQIRGLVGASDVVAMPPTPGNERWTVQWARSYLIARFSPRGDLAVACTTDGNIETVTLNGKVIGHLPGGEFTNVSSLALAPDGVKIAIEGDYRPKRNRPLSTKSDWKRVLAIGSVGSEGLLVLAEGPKGSRLSESDDIGWAPESDRLVYERGRQIWVYDIKLGKNRPIASGANPTWAPDGNWIAYLDVNGAARLVAPATSEVRHILSRRKMLSGLHWSPDSRYILFSSEESGQGAAFFVYRLCDGAVGLAARPYLIASSRDFGWLRTPKIE